MNAAHTVALIYKIKPNPSYDFSKAEPLDTKETDFRVTISNHEVRFEFTKHYATVDAAREAVKGYINNWEFSACLENGPDYFKLEFDREEGRPSPVRLHLEARQATGTSSPLCYPPPPSGLKLTADVRTMYERYMGYLQGEAKLPDVAYFCWTMIQDILTTEKDGKDFSENVGPTIRRLSTTKGGQDARKKDGKDEELTTQENCFLKEAIKVLIRRAAERAYAPDGNLPKICLSDLPSLKSPQQDFG